MVIYSVRRRPTMMAYCNNMAKFTMMLFLVGCVAVTGAYAQWDIKAIDFKTITVEKAVEEMKTMEGERQFHDFAVAVIAAKRLDLIAICFKSTDAMGWIRNEVAGLPDSPFKAAIAIMMLRSDSPFWPPDGPVLQGSQPIGGQLAEPFVSILKEHLPAILPNQHLLDTRSARFKLADELEAAIKGEGVSRDGKDRSSGVPALTAPRRDMLPPESSGISNRSSDTVPPVSDAAPVRSLPAQFPQVVPSAANPNPVAAPSQQVPAAAQSVPAAPIAAPPTQPLPVANPSVSAPPPPAVTNAAPKNP